MKIYDFVIAGAGIVGLSVAKELTERFPHKKIAIIEKEKQIGLHASGRNSGVLHSGIYYPEDSLKAKVCAEGARRMKAFAQEHGIACHSVGKVIIATAEHELPIIDKLLKNAQNNQIQAHRLDADQIRKLEPNAAVHLAGISTPATASIDSKAILKKLTEIIISGGVDLYLDEKIITVDSKKHTVSTPKHAFSFGHFFNCAGAGTDKIAHQFGLAKDYRLLPFKGLYHKLKKEKNHLVRGNIYPVPDLNLPFLGVHFSRGMDGEVYVGPTAIPAFGRENYGLFQGMNFEALRIVKDIGLMYIANHQHFRLLIHSEMKKYAKKYFAQCASKLVSNVCEEDLISSNKVGIRPQLINTRNKKIEMDYIIEQNGHSTHVLNAISPAFTGALRFAEIIVDSV